MQNEVKQKRPLKVEVLSEGVFVIENISYNLNDMSIVALTNLQIQVEKLLDEQERKVQQAALIHEITANKVAAGKAMPFTSKTSQSHYDNALSKKVKLERINIMISDQLTALDEIAIAREARYDDLLERVRHLEKLLNVQIFEENDNLAQQ